MASPKRRNVNSATLATSTRSVVEAVEARILFHLEVVDPQPDLTVAAGSAATTIDLTSRIDNEETDTVVRMSTNSGDMDIQLFDRQKPITVVNFLNYVRRNAYANTFFHRSANLGGPDPASAQLIIQGGGYALPVTATGTFNRIATDAPIELEVQANGVIPNTRGTIAMARTSEQNSATSEFFINTTDNTNTLGPENGGGYAVFGELVNDTVGTADAIAALQTGSVPETPFSDLPARDTAGDLGAENLVVVTGTTVLPDAGTTYAVTSSNPAIVTAAVNNGTLSLSAPAGAAAGPAEITVTATQNGATVTDAFNVTVGGDGGGGGGGTPGSVTIGEGAARQVTFVDADGTTATVSLRGGGTAVLDLAGTGLTQTTDGRGIRVTGPVTSITALTLNGTDGRTTVNVRARGGTDNAVDVNGITAAGGVRNLSGRQLSVTGPVTLGSAARVDLADLTNATLTINGTTPVSINIDGAVTDSTVTSTAAIRSFRADSVGGTDAEPQAIQAPSIGRLTVGSELTGDVRAANDAGGTIGNVTAGGAFTGNLSGFNLGSFRAGAITDSTFNLVQNIDGSNAGIRRLQVNGPITNSDVRSTNGIGTVTANGMSGSSLFAGVRPEVADALPTREQFVGNAPIRSVTLRGGAAAQSFVNSYIAAGSIGRLNLGTVQQTNAGGTAFGVATLSSPQGGAAGVRSVAATDASGGAIRLSRLTEPTQSFDREDFEIRVL